MRSTLPLSRAFRASRTTDEPAATPKLDKDLEGELEDIIAAARAAWPGVQLGDEELVRHLAERTPAGKRPSELCTRDLYLACACLRHDPVALAAFESGYLARIRAMVAHLRLGDAELDELRQQLRSDLLVAEPGRRAKLATYQGQGELAGWLRVTAVRAGLRLLPQKTERDDAPLSEMAAAGQNPELALLKAADQAAFMAAFREAMATLTPEEQNLLRQHYVDGLSIDRLGELHRTHRTSCARWLRQTREMLFKRTKSILMKRTRASRSQCESMIRQAQSHLDITFRSLLR